MDKRTEEVEDDIDEIEDLAKEAKKERDDLLDGECKDYQNPCE